jgi:TolB-like protein/DNA-binding winged helix-turn-helix (wHTH) protein
MARGLQAGFRLGKFEVIPDTGELHSAAGIAVLHPQTMKLLVHLAEHAGELIPSRQLREAVWPSASVSDETVQRCIRELRHRLHDNPESPTFIEESADRSYRLIAPVTPSQVGVSAEPPSPVQRFLGQLKRRKVFRVVAGYTVVGWLLLQVTDILSEAVPWLPDNSLTILTILLASGFPIALVMAWWLEITDEGIVLDPETERRWPQVAKVWRPVAVGLALAAGAGLATFLLTREEIWESEQLAAAVLPFDDLSEAGAANSCGWLTEEMTDALANIRELRVAARTSAESLAEAKLAVTEIAERLRVHFILEGSCGADNERLRITAQLIEADEGFHLWSQQYDIPWSERLKVVREIARRVAESLAIELSDESERRLGRVPTKNDQAYVAYQQGRRYLGMSREEKHLAAAEELFKRAISLDDDFAEAHAGLCDTYLAWYELRRDMSRFKQAENACLQALETKEFAA